MTPLPGGPGGAVRAISILLLLNLGVRPQVPTPRLERIYLHPIKSLDPIAISEARIGPAGSLELDRAWALFSTDGRWVNGKRTAAMHLIRANFAPDVRSVALSVPGDRRNLPPRKLAFPEDTESAAQWFSDYFDQQIIVRQSREGFPDDTVAHGPTIISTATLQAVCDWFPGLSLDEARQRFRTTLEIDGVPAFWEDQLFGEDERSVIRFHVGEVAFEGSNPCARCPVPARNPETGIVSFALPVGEPNTSFQKHFSDQRRACLPSRSPAARFDHFYRAATNTRIASSESGKLLRIGELLTLSGLGGI